MSKEMKEILNKSPVWAAVCVKLLQGPLYRTGNADSTWATLKAWQSEIDRYFGRGNSQTDSGTPAHRAGFLSVRAFPRGS